MYFQFVCELFVAKWAHRYLYFLTGNLSAIVQIRTINFIRLLYDNCADSIKMNIASYYECMFDISGHIM